MNLSWDAKRDGHVYCSPACGRGCTYKEFQNAARKAKNLAKRLGKGWKPKVHENLGWHYNVVSPTGHIKVHEYEYTKEKSYTAFLSEPGDIGGVYVGRGKNPNDAIKDVLKEARKDLEQLKGWLGPFAHINF